MMSFTFGKILAYSVLLVSIRNASPAEGDAYSLISRHQTDCELETLSLGSALADKYNSFFEGTEQQERLRNEYLMQRLKFLTQPGSAGRSNFSDSSYWALENQWIYMIGDATQKKIWTTLAAGVSLNASSGRVSEVSTEKCLSQAAHRSKQSSGEVAATIASQQVTNVAALLSTADFLLLIGTQLYHLPSHIFVFSLTSLRHVKLTHAILRSTTGNM